MAAKREILYLSQITTNEENPRYITDDNFNKLVKSLLTFPRMLELRPIVIDSHYCILGGNMRYKALKHIAAMSEKEIADIIDNENRIEQTEKAVLKSKWEVWKRNQNVLCVRTKDLSDEEKREFIIKDNASYGEWDFEALNAKWNTLPLNDWGIASWQIQTPPYYTQPQQQQTTEAEATKEAEEQQDEQSQPSIEERFIIPPFSVLDTRSGRWQKRKRYWREKIGATNGETREGKLDFGLEMVYPKLYQEFYKVRKTLPEGMNFKTFLETIPKEKLEHEQKSVFAANVSLFDPVLSEIMCNWFSPKKGARIFDPFAGDTQKGLVFAMCGYNFTGIELRQEQVDANNKDIKERGLNIKYICDDGRNVAKHFKPESQDLLFSCPPYYDLEQYSEKDEDASNQRTYKGFIDILEEGFKNAYKCLKKNRFAVIVVGDVRNRLSEGYFDFPADIVRMFKSFGATFLNKIILIEQVGTNCLRCANNMKHRKLSKVHQEILVFYKGNASNIKDIFSPIDLSGEEEQLLDNTLNDWNKNAT